MKVFILMDSCDSWSGETTVYSVYRSKERALEALESRFNISRKLYEFYELKRAIGNLDEQGIEDLMLKTLGESFSTPVRNFSIAESVEHIYSCGLSDWWDNTAGIDIVEAELEDE